MNQQEQATKRAAIFQDTINGTTTKPARRPPTRERKPNRRRRRAATIRSDGTRT